MAHWVSVHLTHSILLLLCINMDKWDFSEGDGNKHLMVLHLIAIQS